MEISTIKALIKVSMNISNDFKVPMFQVLEKNKEYETRLYEKTKYAYLTYQTIDEPTNDAKGHCDQDLVMKRVIKLMKYTQGDNVKKITMPFIMPVFVCVETLESREHLTGQKENKIFEVKVMVSLPPEYQQHEAPAPNDPEIELNIIEQFKCFVKSFSGFACDKDYKNQARQLAEIVKAEKGETVDLVSNKVICISYDAPYVLMGRRNEVQIIFKQK